MVLKNSNPKITTLVSINLPQFLDNNTLLLPTETEIKEINVTITKNTAIEEQLNQLLTQNDAKSKVVILVGIDETVSEEQQNYYVDFISSISGELNVVPIPSNSKIQDVFDGNCLVLTATLKKYWELAQLRNYVNLPVVVQNDEVYFTRCIYFIPSHVLTKKGKQALWNTAIEGVNEVLFTTSTPYNQYQIKDFYLSCMMLYKEYVEGNKYFVSKRINKGNLENLQEAVKIVPI